jgi:nucleoside phosphorylase
VPNEADDSIDWVVLTAIPLEYQAVVAELREPKELQDWLVPVTVGVMGDSRVICVLSGKGGNRTAATLQYIVERTRVSKVVLVGIAGGFPEQKVARGDVIIARSVLGYDFGKLVNGKYIRRPEEDWQCDEGLVSHAEIIATDSRKPWFQSIELARPDGQPTGTSTVHVGYLASGDKVVDDADHDFFREVRASIPEIHAVEMEAAGAAAAVRLRQMSGVMRFVVIKGISDQLYSNGATEARSGKEQRAQWARYAATAAVTLARALIKKVKPTGGPSARSANQDSADFTLTPLPQDDSPEVPALYRRFEREWVPALLNQQEGVLSLVDSIDWLLRSLVPAFRRQWLAILVRYSRNDQLPERLSVEEEDTIRQLRNLGLVQHDGRYLFTPSRSRRLSPTPAGRLLIALHLGDQGLEREEIARNVVRELSEVAHNPTEIALLAKVHR